jgi:hypothetical protein
LNGAPHLSDFKSGAKKADMWDRTEITLALVFLAMGVAVLGAAWFFDDMVAIVSIGG